MDSDALVENRIDDGSRLVKELPRHGFDVAAAFWLQPSEDGKWYFYIVSSIVDAEGPVGAYRRLHPLVRAMPQLSSIDPLEIKLIGLSHPIARDVARIPSRTQGPRPAPIRWSGNSLGNVSIDDAYVYPLPATAP